MIDQIILMNNEAAKKSELEIKLKTAPYTTLQESAPPFLISQIEQSIVAYINNVILDSENDFEETEENLLALLNHESVYFDQEVQIIEKSITKINLLNNIDNERLWKVILDKNKAEPTWSSLLVYYESTGSVFDETIISFLNRENNYTKLALNQISANDFSVNYREITDTFETHLIGSNELDNKAYNPLMDVLSYQYNDIDIESLSNDKVLTLLKHEKLNLTQENIENLRSKSKSLTIELIEIHSAKFIDDRPQDIELNTDEYEAILNSAKFSASDKKIILERDYADSNELPESIRKSIIAIYGQLSLPIPLKFLDNIFANTQSTIAKIELLISQINSLERATITKYLEMLESPYNEIMLGRKHTLMGTDINIKLTSNLHKYGYINKPNISKKPLLGLSKITFSPRVKSQ